MSVKPEHVCLRVRIDPAIKRVDGEVSHRVRALRDSVSRIAVDSADLSIDAVVDATGEPVSFSMRAGGLDVYPHPPIPRDEVYTFTVRYSAHPSVGLYFVPADGERGPQVWTQGAMEDHQHWFPCFDAPEHMVTTEVIATVPDGYTAISNGEPVGPPQPADDGWVRSHWRHETPHALYLLTLVIDAVVPIECTDHAVLQVNYAPPGRAAQTSALFRRVPQMLDYFGLTTGAAYPYPRYGHVFLRDFMWGGMENTTLTSLTEIVLVEPEFIETEDVERLVAHELAHQWFGDLIAPRGWPEIWLNESFATYFEVLCMGALNGPDDFMRRIMVERESYFAEAKDRYARAVVTRSYADPYVLFDRHAYEKGALVLHSLRHQLGDQAFFRGVQRYVRICRGTAAETPWLKRAFEEETGEDLTDFFEQFVYGAAHPKVEFGWSWRAGAGLEVRIERTDSTEQAVTVELAVCVGEVVTTQRLRLGVGARNYCFPSDRPPLWVALDPTVSVLIEIDENQCGEGSLRARLMTPEAPAALRWRTVRLLGERGGDRNTRALIRTLQNDLSEATRMAAATALGCHRSMLAREGLVGVLDAEETSWRVRVAAARALGVGASAGQVPDLQARLDAEAHYLVRAALLGALGEIRDPAARAVIDEWLDAESCRDRVAVAALGALAAQKDSAAIDPMLARAEPGHRRAIRQTAIGCLGRLGTIDDLPAEDRRRVREALERYLRDPVFHARYAAISALARLRDKASAAALERAHGAERFGLLRRAIREALGKLPT